MNTDGVHLEECADTETMVINADGKKDAAYSRSTVSPFLYDTLTNTYYVECPVGSNLRQDTRVKTT